MPELVNQVTVSRNGQRVDELTVSVNAVSELAARQRARTWLRRNFPTIKNILSPEVTGQNSRQTTFNDIVPQPLEREEYKVKVTAVF